MNLWKHGLGIVKTGATGVSVLLLAFVMSAPTIGAYGGTPAPTTAMSYGGRAYGLGVLTVFGDTYYADTGDLPSDGGVLFAPFVDVNTDVASASVFLSYTRGFNDLGITEAATADITLLPGSDLEITTSFVYARSSADCNGVSGRSEIFDLTIGGVPVGVSGDPNEVVYDIPGVLTVVANEQIDQSWGLTHSLTVNGLHVWTVGAELIVSSATSTVTCAGGGGGLLSGGSSGSVGTRGGGMTTVGIGGGLPKPLHVPPADFMTGGGHFLPPNSNRPGDVNFGFNAGPRPGQPTTTKGNLNLIDHASSHHLKGDVIDYFQYGDPQDVCRRWAGPATFDGQTGYHFDAVTCDYGEPGRDDRFAINVWLGNDATVENNAPVYHADNYDGTPAPEGGNLNGGNIQLHSFG